ncbi:MAG: hypothetical protein U0903_12100 [Planctomycetales bacterium]
MKTTLTKPHPFVQRGRPIDATGLFWALVLVPIGCFYSVVFLGWNDFVLEGVVFLGVVAGLLWQFRRWKFDAVTNRQATEWCRQHYPELVGTPVVDWLVALVHILRIDLRTLKPSSVLVDLAMSAYGKVDMPFDDFPEILEDIAYDARICIVEWSSFSGSTVDDAIQFVVRSCGNNTGVHSRPAGESS